MDADMLNVVVRDETIDGERKTMARVTLDADSKFVEMLDAWCKLTDECRKIDLRGAGWTVQYLVPAYYLFSTIPVDDE